MTKLHFRPNKDQLISERTRFWTPFYCLELQCSARHNGPWERLSLNLSPFLTGAILILHSAAVVLGEPYMHLVLTCTLWTYYQILVQLQVQGESRKGRIYSTKNPELLYMLAILIRLCVSKSVTNNTYRQSYMRKTFWNLCQRHNFFAPMLIYVNHFHECKQ